MSITKTEINEFISKFTVENANNDVNVILLSGKNHNILIDSGYPPTSEELHKALREISNNQVKIIINTHHHSDHTGANHLFDSTVICHDHARDRIRGKFYNLSGYIEKGVGDITISKDMTLFLDDKKIDVIPLPPSHTNGDMIIYIEEYRTLIMGDILFSKSFPFIDINNGGDIDGLINTYKWIIKTFSQVEKIIAGHGPDMDLKSFTEYVQLLEESYGFIRKSLNSGETKEQILGSDKFNELKGKLSDGERLAPLWIDIISNYISRSENPGKISIMYPMTEYIEKGDIPAAISFYRENSKSEDYSCNETDMTMIGYNLLFRDRQKDALKMFKLYVEAYPESSNSYDSLGECYMNMNDKKNARINYSKALELDPENEYIKGILEKIGS